MPIFVIGSPEEPKFLRRLSAYVHEAERIRKFRMDDEGYKKVQSLIGLEDPEANDENDRDGFYRTRARTIAIKRLHGKVQIALKARLKK